MWVLVVVLVEYKVMKIGWGMKEGGLDGLPHLQYINFSSLSDKKSVIASEPCYHCPYFDEEGRY